MSSTTLVAVDPVEAQAAGGGWRVPALAVPLAVAATVAWLIGALVVPAHVVRPVLNGVIAPQILFARARAAGHTTGHERVGWWLVFVGAIITAVPLLDS